MFGAGRGPQMPKQESSRRRRNAAQKRALKSAEIARFMKEVGRKAQKGVEPNDRRYDSTFAKSLRRMSPEELDRLAREDEDEDASGAKYNIVALRYWSVLMSVVPFAFCEGSVFSQHGPVPQGGVVGQFEVAFDAFQKIVTAYAWRTARKSGPTVFPTSC
jgi:hypothetical protein